MVLSKTRSMEEADSHVIDSIFASRYIQVPLPRWALPENETPKDASYQMIADELMLDGNPRLNLASSVTTWMEPECEKLIQASLNKNFIDMDEYPVTTEIQDGCVNMITRMFNVLLGDAQSAIGTGTVGSSEAIMLAGLAFKRKLQLQRRAAGLLCDKSNMVTGAHVQGYQKIIANCAENAKILADDILAIGRFKILSKPVGVPLVAFAFKDCSRYDEYQIAEGLHRYGWIVPAHTIALDAQNVSLLRVVVREDFSRSLADRLVAELRSMLETLDSQPPKLVQAVAEAIQEQHPGLADKSVEEIKKAASTVSEADGKLAEDHRGRILRKVHKPSIHKVDGVC